jgi:hypothetical protein
MNTAFTHNHKRAAKTFCKILCEPSDGEPSFGFIAKVNPQRRTGFSDVRASYTKERHQGILSKKGNADYALPFFIGNDFYGLKNTPLPLDLSCRDSILWA